MTPDRLATMAEALWGFGWQTALAREQGYNVRTVQRWASGEWKIPDDLELELLALMRQKIDALYKFVGV